MGGKTWSREEEEFFWHVIIPQSPKAVKVEDRINDWEECAKIMVRAMGKEARRKYTRLMLFEHYFQNVQTGHFSPHAVAFVNEHKQQLADEEKHFQVDASASVAAEDTRSSFSPRLRPIAVPRARLARNPEARNFKSLPRLLIPNSSYSPAPGVFPSSATSSSPASSPSSWTWSDRIATATPASFGADWTQGDFQSSLARGPWSTISPLTNAFCYFPRDQRFALQRPDLIPHGLPLPYTSGAPPSILGKRPVDQASGQVHYPEAMRVATYDVRDQGQLPMNSLVMAASLDYHSVPLTGSHGYSAFSTPLTSPTEIYSPTNIVDDGTANQGSSTVDGCRENDDGAARKKN